MKEIVILITVVAVFTISIIGSAIFVHKVKCESAYENYQPQFGVISGCRIMVEGKLTPVDIVRELN